MTELMNAVIATPRRFCRIIAASPQNVPTKACGGAAHILPCCVPTGAAIAILSGSFLLSYQSEASRHRQPAPWRWMASSGPFGPRSRPVDFTKRPLSIPCATYAATHLFEAGVNVHIIQVWMGHTSPTTTAIYTHLTQEAETQAADVIDRLLVGLL